MGRLNGSGHLKEACLKLGNFIEHRIGSRSMLAEDDGTVRFKNCNLAHLLARRAVVIAHVSISCTGGLNKRGEQNVRSKTQIKERSVACQGQDNTACRS